MANSLTAHPLLSSRFDYIDVDNIIKITPHSNLNMGYIHTNEISASAYGSIILHETIDEKWMHKLLSLIYEAKIESEENRKPIILDFTGSNSH